jgi:hypothetical protein
MADELDFMMNANIAEILKPQVPPLRFAPVGMTDFLDGEFLL